MLRRRLGHAYRLIEDQIEPRIVLHLLACDARIKREDLHSALSIVERKRRQLGDHTKHAAMCQTAFGAGVAASDKTRAGYEIHLLHEASLLMLHRDDHICEARDIVAAASARKSYRRLLPIPDERRIEVAILV